MHAVTEKIPLFLQKVTLNQILSISFYSSIEKDVGFPHAAWVGGVRLRQAPELVIVFVPGSFNVVPCKCLVMSALSPRRIPQVIHDTKNLNRKFSPFRGASTNLLISISGATRNGVSSLGIHGPFLNRLSCRIMTGGSRQMTVRLTAQTLALQKGQCHLLFSSNGLDFSNSFKKLIHASHKKMISTARKF
jgi:hypothetical protein